MKTEVRIANVVAIQPLVAELAARGDLPIVTAFRIASLAITLDPHFKRAMDAVTKLGDPPTNGDEEGRKKWDENRKAILEETIQIDQVIFPNTATGLSANDVLKLSPFIGVET